MVLKDRFKVIQIFRMKLRDIVHRVLSLKVFVFFFSKLMKRQQLDRSDPHLIKELSKGFSIFLSVIIVRDDRNSYY